MKIADRIFRTIFALVAVFLFSGIIYALVDDCPETWWFWTLVPLGFLASVRNLVVGLSWLREESR